MPKQHKYLLLIYKYRGKTHTAMGVSLRGGPYGFSVEPGYTMPLSTRKQTNFILTHLNKQWINQIQIHRPNKIMDLSPLITTTEYTLFTHFVNKIRRFFNLPEKY